MTNLMDEIDGAIIDFNGSQIIGQLLSGGGSGSRVSGEESSEQ